MKIEIKYFFWLCLFFEELSEAPFLSLFEGEIRIWLANIETTECEYHCC